MWQVRTIRRKVMPLYEALEEIEERRAGKVLPPALPEEVVDLIKISRDRLWRLCREIEEAEYNNEANRKAVADECTTYAKEIDCLFANFGCTPVLNWMDTPIGVPGLPSEVVGDLSYARLDLMLIARRFVEGYEDEWNRAGLAIDCFVEGERLDDVLARFGYESIRSSINDALYED